MYRIIHAENIISKDLKPIKRVSLELDLEAILDLKATGELQPMIDNLIKDIID